ncbi:MAG: adenine phosphoribosyltransferase [Dehalococcoidia bacterium]|nr:adenine phosphoribosyltransferase [Dehalococcoidia bacterium]
MLDLTRYVRDIPDFPVPGILFRDITPLLGDAAAFRCAVDGITDYVSSRGPDAVVGIESRGFLFGAPVADRLGLPFVPVRKPGRLPAARVSIDVTLEYGAGSLDIHADALAPGARAVIIDDLLATGGTATGASRLVELLGARVAGLAFVIELASLGGRAALASYDVHALVRYA